MFNFLKFWKKKKSTVISRFKVKAKDCEILTIEISGNTPQNVADLSNKLKSLLSVQNNNDPIKFDFFGFMDEEFERMRKEFYARKKSYKI
jgi:hypothetical protein